VEFKILFTPQAVNDLKKIEAYLRKQGAADPAGYRRKLSERPLELAVLPSRGGPMRHDPNVRYLVEGRYLIIYRIVRSQRIVKVLRFWHAARDVLRLRLK
jgi:plasmid stabilization system protein ParE